MSVIVKGASIPDICQDCFAFGHYQITAKNKGPGCIQICNVNHMTLKDFKPLCDILDNVILTGESAWHNTPRPHWCPLQELPEESQ